MVVRATIELFGNGAIAKTMERLVEVEGNEKSVAFWRELRDEVRWLHKRRHEF